MRYLFVLLFLYGSLFAGMQNLDLNSAIELLKKNNSDIKIAKFNEDIAKFQTKIAKSYNYGMLDLTFNALRSNDAGNVFGFKLQSREATFADFGFDEFLAPMGYALRQANSGSLTPQDLQNMNSILGIEPKLLNYPEARSHFQTKLSYMVPLYTGGKLTQYEKISRAMEKMSHLDTKKIINEKIYQTKKTFYDITLVDNLISNLETLYGNIEKLEDIVQTMIEEGYAKDTDLLEVQAKKAEVLSFLNQAKLNRDLAYQFLSFLVGTQVESIRHTDELARLPEGETKELVEKTIDLKKVKLGMKISDMNVRLQKSGFYPTLGAFGEYGSADNKPFNDFTDKDAYTVGMQMKWNLFNGGETSASVQKAKIEKMKVYEQYSLAKRGLALKINKIKTEVKSKDYDIQSNEKQLDFAKRVYENYQERYKEGLVGINEVLIKHSEEIKVLMNLLKVKTERNEKVFELESILDKGE
ncbi:TolC family protein [Nitrosophilus alvini]|uniref:TolC family protein n=1 Tax=Nitrosophilus alvini TaxID=2714855 RepID=UPI00190C8C85|nr:TolC family protein [Nitrosophilus alvini]